MPASSKPVLFSVLALLAAFPISHAACAMSFEQMSKLAGAALLDLRVDAVLKDCGLPAVIVDAADAAPQRQAMRWAEAEMELSSANWDVTYSRQRDAASRATGWTNSGPGSATCLSGLAGLVLHAKGNAGVLTVEKRADSQGYRTTYRVPDDLYAAHQVIGLTGTWQEGRPVSSLLAQYGKPDERLEGKDGITRYRYWVVVNQKGMPVSVHAVDFAVRGAESVCSSYTVQTAGFEFVQEKFDALWHQWVRDYVND